MPVSRNIAVGLLLLALALTANAGSVKYRQFDENLKGILQVVHVSSLAKANKVKSAHDCEVMCASVVDCNAWVYCDKPGGCGTTCQTHLAANPVLKLSGKVEFADLIRPGPFAKLCMGQAWTYGLCSLKQTKKPAAPEFWPVTTGGYISGTIQLPSECKGVSARTCTRCSKASNPAKCLACAKRANGVQGETAKVNRLLAKGKVLSDNCR